MLLLNLPRELLVLIFCACDSPHDLLRLASSARLLRAVWLSASSRISNAVIASAVLCLPEACLLLDSQLRSPHSCSPLGRLFRLHSNAEQVARAAEVYDEVACEQYHLATRVRHLRRRPHLSHAELELFTHIFYRLQILATMPRSNRVEALRATSLLDLHRMRDLLVWAQMMTQDMKKLRVGLDATIWTGPLLDQVWTALRAAAQHRGATVLDPIGQNSDIGFWNFYAFFEYHQQSGAETPMLVAMA